jgi:hypothetical protein
MRCYRFAEAFCPWAVLTGTNSVIFFTVFVQETKSFSRGCCSIFQNWFRKPGGPLPGIGAVGRIEFSLTVFSWWTEFRVQQQICCDADDDESHDKHRHPIGHFPLLLSSPEQTVKGRFTSHNAGYSRILNWDQVPGPELGNGGGVLIPKPS